MKHSFESNKEHIIENSMYHEQFDDDDLLNNMGNLAQTKEKNQVFRKRATRLGTLTPAKAEMMRIKDLKNKVILNSFQHLS